MKRIVILGAAESGVGAAALAKKQGFDVFVTDMGKIKPNYKEMLNERNIPWEEGQHSEALILNADEIIKSPGIPDAAPMVQKIKAAGINIISDIGNLQSPTPNLVKNCILDFDLHFGVFYKFHDGGLVLQYDCYFIHVVLF